MAGDARHPSFWSAIALFVLVQLIAVLVRRCLELGFGTFEGVDVVGSIVGFGLVLALAIRRTGRRAGEVLPFRPISPGSAGVVALTISGLVLVQIPLERMLVSIWPLPPWFAQLYESLLAGSALTGFVRVALVAPLGEELFVRGLVLSAFVRRYGHRRSIVLTALLFALLHANPWQAAPAFLAGLLFGWWTLRARSLTPALLGHVLVNGLIYAANVHPDLAPEIASVTGVGVRRLPPALVLAGPAVLLMGIALSVRSIGKPMAYPVARSGDRGEGQTRGEGGWSDRDSTGG